MSTAASAERIACDQIGYFYDAAVPPVLSVAPGTTVAFETQDARGGAIFVNPVGELVDLPRPLAGRGNPVTAPLEVRGPAMRCSSTCWTSRPFRRAGAADTRIWALL